MKPVKSRIKLWAEALASGNFRQTFHILKRKSTKGDLFCALGVACRVYEQKTGTRVDYSTDKTYGVMPIKIANWYGLQSENPRVCIRSSHNGFQQCGDISDLNDKLRATFPDIASAISREWLS